MWGMLLSPTKGFLVNTSRRYFLCCKAIACRLAVYKNQTFPWFLIWLYPGYENWWYKIPLLQAHNLRWFVVLISIGATIQMNSLLIVWYYWHVHTNNGQSCPIKVSYTFFIKSFSPVTNICIWTPLLLWLCQPMQVIICQIGHIVSYSCKLWFKMSLSPMSGKSKARKKGEK